MMMSRRSAALASHSRIIRQTLVHAGTIEVMHRGETYRAAYSLKKGRVHILTLSVTWRQNLSATRHLRRPRG